VGRPGPGDVSTSLGAVSAVGERWWTARGGVIEAYVKADLTMFPGFSGGPLVDVGGRVVGLNSSLLGRGEHVAIPAALLDATVQKLISGQPVKRAYLGITSQPTALVQALRDKTGLTQERALLIMWVEPGSPADQAGLMVGDLLFGIGGHPVSNARDLIEALTPDRVGKPVPVAVLRGGNRVEVSLTPTERD
jgi:S1-C subfamily serine protease